MLDRLNAEISIHHQVKHPNIVELLNCFCDDKYVYLILELCSHGDLEHHLQEKKVLSEHESKQACVQSPTDLLTIVSSAQPGTSPSKSSMD